MTVVATTPGHFGFRLPELVDAIAAAAIEQGVAPAHIACPHEKNRDARSEVTYSGWTVLLCAPCRDALRTRIGPGEVF